MEQNFRSCSAINYRESLWSNHISIFFVPYLLLLLLLLAQKADSVTLAKTQDLFLRLFFPSPPTFNILIILFATPLLQV